MDSTASPKRMTTYIIRIREETNTGNYTGPNVIPSKGCSVDFRQRQATTFVRIVDMSEVVIEVMKGRIATNSLVLLSHLE